MWSSLSLEGWVEGEFIWKSSGLCRVPASKAWGNRRSAPPTAPSGPSAPPFPFSLCSALNVFLWAIGGEQRRQPGKPGPSLTSSVRHLSRATGTPVCWHSCRHMSFSSCTHLACACARAGGHRMGWELAVRGMPHGWFPIEGSKTPGPAWSLKLGRAIQIESFSWSTPLQIQFGCAAREPHVTGPQRQRSFTRSDGAWYRLGD